MFKVWKSSSLVSLLQVAVVLIVCMTKLSIHSSILFTAIGFSAISALILIYCVVKNIQKTDIRMIVAYHIVLGALALSAIGLVFRFFAESNAGDAFTAMFDLGLMAFILSFHIGTLNSEPDQKKLNITSSLPLGIGLILGAIIGFGSKKF